MNEANTHRCREVKIKSITYLADLFYLHCYGIF